MNEIVRNGELLSEPIVAGPGFPARAAIGASTVVREWTDSGLTCTSTGRTTKHGMCWKVFAVAAYVMFVATLAAEVVRLPFMRCPDPGSRRPAANGRRVLDPLFNL
jgi:hypothetical protein